ncbi:hypothetical protein [Microlunatus sp. Gsoil 973]|uniref:hypothetical protein n=1 Tax=Microlunatus sp. Gsoil 973 TaxID=2672569 RepID=UPI001E29B0BA|nr:hypothetical protein [Microlunatus sp. Gsoil 973]
MTKHHAQQDPHATGKWLNRVARAAAADAKAPVELLGEYLSMLSDAALTGRRPETEQLAVVRRLGRQAAEQGIDADQAVTLYLSAAWRLWQQIPAVVRTRDRDAVSAAAEAVLRVVNDAVEALVDGHQASRQEIIRQEESARREFVDDLLRGDADVPRLVQRAKTFGLDLGRPHEVLLAAPTTTTAHRQELSRIAVTMERVIVDRYGDREVLVAIKDAMIVMIIPGELQSHERDAHHVRPANLLLGGLAPS